MCLSEITYLPEPLRPIGPAVFTLLTSCILRVFPGLSQFWLIHAAGDQPAAFSSQEVSYIPEQGGMNMYILAYTEIQAKACQH